MIKKLLITLSLTICASLSLFGQSRTVMVDASSNLFVYPTTTQLVTANGLATQDYVATLLGNYATESYVDSVMANVSVDLTGYATETYVTDKLLLYLSLAGTQTITGTKTFSTSPIVPTPTGTTHAANKSYVDTAIEAATTPEPEVLEPELYLIYQTSSSSTTTYRVDFDTTDEMKAWIKSNYSSLRYSLKVVRKNVDDGFTDYSRFFYGYSASASSTYRLQITSLDLSEFDTTGATDMSRMFYWCNNLTSLDLSNFDTSNVTNMSYMFYWCYELTSLDLSNFDTSNVTNMSDMFYECSSLTSLDLSSFDTSNVTDMSDMFYSCDRLTSLDLSNFDTSNVTSMSSMFRYCYNLKVVLWATNKTTLEPLQTNSYLGTYVDTIYVPDSLVSSYKAAAYFSAWSSSIKGVSDALITIAPRLSYEDTSDLNNNISIFVDLYYSGIKPTYLASFTSVTSVYSNSAFVTGYFTDCIVKVLDRYGKVIYFFSTVGTWNEAMRDAHGSDIIDSGAKCYYYPTGRYDNAIANADMNTTTNRLRAKQYYPANRWEDYTYGGSIANFEENLSGKKVYKGITRVDSTNIDINGEIKITAIQIYPSQSFIDSGIFSDPNNSIIVNRQTPIGAELDGSGRLNGYIFRPAIIQYNR